MSKPDRGPEPTIADALKATSTEQQVVAARALATAQLDEARAAHDAAIDRAASPFTSDLDAEESSAEAVRHELRARRLGAAIVRLDERATAIVASDKAAVQLAAYREARAAHDEAVRALRDDYPAVVERFVEIAMKVSAAKELARRIGVRLDDPELEGRGKRSFADPSIMDVNLPAARHDPLSSMAWPIPDRSLASAMAQATSHLSARYAAATAPTSNALASA